MTDLGQLDAAISRYVRPATFPLAIRMIAADEPLPARARRPQRDMDVQVTICQAVGISRRYGWVMHVTPDDLSCPLVFVPFGFAKPVDFQIEGHACEGIYTETAEAGAVSEQMVPRLDYGKYAAILMSPLDRAEFEPQVVCVYGNSAQVMRLVQASLFGRGGALNSLSTGRIDCSEIIIRTLLTQQPQYILPCSGDRIFGLTDDDEMIFAMPIKWADEVVHGLEATHAAGIRYPVPKFMRFQPQYPPQYEKLREALTAESEQSRVASEPPPPESPRKRTRSERASAPTKRAQ
jgi:uncharacterized protein (DUF169 family)